MIWAILYGGIISTDIGSFSPFQGECNTILVNRKDKIFVARTGLESATFSK